MNLYDSKLYNEDIRCAAGYEMPFYKLKGRSLAISGGTGMIGSFLVDVLMYKNKVEDLTLDIYILGRSKTKAAARFREHLDSPYYHFVECDINTEDITKLLPDEIDYIIHAASTTHPRAYSTDPIGTITSNIIGLQKLLEWAVKAKCKRFEFLSSVEIYGENKGDTDKFSEDYLGYIDCNTLRAAYPESKRLGEAMCQAYISQKGLDIVIPRLSRVYGPTMLMTDTKALSQFILKGANKEDIVLKSEGTQEYSYAYVADAALAMLHIMLEGANGNVYNIASKDSDIMLKDLAKKIAMYAGKQVIFELPDAIESAGYSKATKATLATDKLCELGFVSQYDIKTGIEHTIDILADIMGK